MTDFKPPEQRDTQRVVLIVALSLALYLSLGIVLWILLNSYVNPTAIENASKEATTKKDLIQAWGFIMAGVAGAVGIFFTWRGQRLAREAQELNQRNTQEQLRLSRQSQEQNQQSTREQLENAQEELRLTRQGQMTERFTQAIEQLGSDKLEIKLGGIYSLERTAQEEKNYHWPVMEVLTSYVRRHAARNPLTEMESGENAANPEADIQAILEVISRRSEDHRNDTKVEYGTIDLNNTDLQGAKLQKADLLGAHFQGANLRGADLRGANLEGANLEGAILQKANLDSADLRRADLSGADLQGAILLEANLAVANLAGANLQEAILLRATLLGAILLGVDLRGAYQLPEDQIEWTLGSDETKLDENDNRPEMWSKSYEEQEKILNELGRG